MNILEFPFKSKWYNSKTRRRSKINLSNVKFDENLNDYDEIYSIKFIGDGALLHDIEEINKILWLKLSKNKNPNKKFIVGTLEINRNKRKPTDGRYWLLEEVIISIPIKQLSEEAK